MDAGPIAMAIQGMGMEKVLEVLPLEGEGGLIGARRLWLFPLLSTHGRRRPSHLRYFQTSILELARKSNEVVIAPKVRTL